MAPTEIVFPFRSRPRVSGDDRNRADLTDFDLAANERCGYGRSAIRLLQRHVEAGIPEETAILSVEEWNDVADGAARNAYGRKSSLRKRRAAGCCDNCGTG
jgi:hypothetical protein